MPNKKSAHSTFDVLDTRCDAVVDFDAVEAEGRHTAGSRSQRELHEATHGLTEQPDMLGRKPTSLAEHAFACGQAVLNSVFLSCRKALAVKLPEQHHLEAQEARDVSEQLRTVGTNRVKAPLFAL